MNTKGDMLSSRNHIQMIKRELLHPHPDNPRKDLGDLEELRNSIIEHGIMQNLTIVPDGKDYKILIGHRRFAASEGILELLPCVIAEGLTDREQVGIMLVENMQRSDLTVFEQAQGFQMMLDLGDTIETIADKTGFSKATVKHRLEISKIDKKSLEAAQEYFQPTITDFIELEKVKDLKKRNEILSDAECSLDIKNNVKEYLDEMAEQETFEYYKKIFEEAGWTDETEKDQWFYYKEGYKHVDGILDRIDATAGRIKEDELKELMAKIKGEVHFGLCYHAIMVRTYKEPKAKKDRDDEEAKRKALESRCRKNRAALKEIRTQICDAYMDFILNCEYTFKDPKEENQMMDRLLGLCICNSGFSVTLYWLDKDHYGFTDRVSNKGYNKMDPKENPILEEFGNFVPLWQLMVNIWWSFASSYSDFMDGFWTVKKDLLEAHVEFMEHLKLMGFVVKDEWKAVLDGTSDLYKKEAE